nr:aldehyde dehydrogenase family protein [Martelella mediterranea]
MCRADDEDAMRRANDSRYGLGGGIFSRDTAKARRLAVKEFDTDTDPHGRRLEDRHRTRFADGQHLPTCST